MQALPLIVVFAGSSLTALWLAHRFLVPLSKRAAAALLLLPLVLTGRAMFSGGFYGPLNIAYASAPLAARSGELPKPADSYTNGILSDVAITSVPWRKAVREAVSHGQAPPAAWSPWLGQDLRAAGGAVAAALLAEITVCVFSTGLTPSESAWP